MSLGILGKLTSLTSSPAPVAGEKPRERHPASPNPRGYAQDTLQRRAGGGSPVGRAVAGSPAVPQPASGSAGNLAALYDPKRAALYTQQGQSGLARPLATPASVSAAQAGERFLTFAEQLQRDPSKIWNTSLTPRLAGAIQSYKMGSTGGSVRTLNLINKPLAEVRQDLIRRGFQLEQSVIRDVQTGAPVLNPTTGKELPMEVWIHPDGGMVRIKPEGDPTSRFRPQPHLSVSVLYPPGASGHNFNNEAFKVDASGNPLPKWAADASNPFGAETPAGKKWLDDLASRTHINFA